MQNPNRPDLDALADAIAQRLGIGGTLSDAPSSSWVEDPSKPFADADLPLLFPETKTPEDTLSGVFGLERETGFEPAATSLGS